MWLYLTGKAAGLQEENSQGANMKINLLFEDSVSFTWPHLLVVAGWLKSCIMMVLIVCRLRLFTLCVARFPSKSRNREAPGEGVFVLLLLLLLIVFI